MAKAAARPSAPVELESSGPVSVETIIEWIDSAANSIGGVWRCEVFKVFGAPRDGLTEPHLFDCSVEELDGLRVRLHRYGTGKYRVRCKCDRVIRKQFDIEIFEAPLPEVPPPAPANGELATVLKLLIEEQREFRKEIAAALQRTPQTAVDPYEQLKNVTAIMKEMREANPPPPANVGVEMFTKGMEFAEKALALRGDKGGDGEGGGGGLIDLVRDAMNSDFGKQIGGAIADFMQRAPAAPLPAPVPQPMRARIPVQNPRGVPVRAVPLAPAVPAPAASNGVSPDLRLGMNYILEEARRGADPEAVAAYVLSVLPENALDALAVQQDPVGYIEQTFPEARAQHAWLEAFVGKLIELDQDEGTDEPGGDQPADVPLPDAGRPGGDARSVEDDARLNQAREAQSA